jgi:hypothetical protein
MIRDTKPVETVIIEYGYLDNEADCKQLQDHWREYAEAVVYAVCSYAGLPYQVPEANKPRDPTALEILQKYGIITEIPYWEKVLAGTNQCNPEYLAKVFTLVADKLKGGR